MSLFSQLRKCDEQNTALQTRLQECVADMVRVECHRVDIKRALQLDDDELEHQMKRHCAHEKADAEIAAVMDATEFDVTWEPFDDKDKACDFCSAPAQYLAFDDYELIVCRACAKKEAQDVGARGRRILEILERECEMVNETPAQEAERARDRLEWRYFTVDVGFCDVLGCELGARYHLRGGGQEYCPEHFPLKKP
jgi:hypothetical protein